MGCLDSIIRKKQGTRPIFFGCSNFKIRIGEKLIFFFYRKEREKLNSDYKI